MIRPVMGPKWMPLVVCPVAQVDAVVPGNRADDGLAVGAQRTRAGQLLDQFSAFEIRQDVDGALEQFQPGGFGGLAVKLLAREEVSLIVVAAAGAAHAGEAVGAADHVAALW